MFNDVVKTMPLAYQHSTRQIYIDGGFKGACSALATAIWNNDTETASNSLPSCSDVNFRYTENKFALLTLAAIQGNMPAMEALKAKGADLNAQDILGYTALHHMAMLGNEAGVKQLLDWNASPELRTSHGATYMDLLRFTAPFRNATLPLDPKLFSAHTNDRNNFEKACIPSGQDEQLVEEMVAPPAILVGIYAREALMAKEEEKLDSQLEKEQKSFLPLYDAFKKNPPMLAVKPVGNFCGLVAKQLIKKGEIIAECTGKLTAEGWYPPYKENQYNWAGYPSIDAGTFRSPAAMTNEGFPNAATITLGWGSEKGLDGLPNRKFLYALESIEPGKEIRISYGATHPVKRDANYRTLGFGSLQKYLESHSWDAIHKRVRSLHSGKLTPGTSKYLDAVSAREKSFYILDTPRVIQKLAKAGNITQKDIESIRKVGALYNHLNPEGKKLREKARNFAIKSL